MRYFYAAILIVCSVLAFYFATRVFYNKNYKKNFFVAFSMTAFASGLWSAGYGLMMIFEQDRYYMYSRACGIIGLVLFLVSAQLLIGVIAKLSKRFFTYLGVESFAGFIVLIAMMSPDSIRIIHSEGGIITEFNNNVISTVYTAYVIIVAFSFIGLSIYLLSKKFPNSVRAFSKKLLVVEALILGGMIVDTVLPAVGINLNIPASTILQFVGLEIIYFAVHNINHSRISFSNMTEYIYNSMKSPILIFDTEHSLRVANKEANRMFELGDLDKINFWPDVMKSEPFDEIIGASETLVREIYFEESERIISLYMDAIYDQYHDNIGYMMMAADITEIKRNMKAVEEAKNDALKANRAKSMFLANMSHEIRTPMNAIIGFSEMALRDSIDDKSREYMTDIHSSAEALLALINDILDISKIESGKMKLLEEQYPTAEILKELTTIIRVQANKKDLRFDMQIDKDFPSVLFGDNTKIRSMLINLLNNAVKYTKQGTVTFRASFITQGEGFGTAHFEISDTGIGIKPEDIDSIFDTFQRVDLGVNKTTEGTGLGLSITKGFAELMGGDIRVESEYGKGTTFILEFNQKVIDPSPVSFDVKAEKIVELKDFKLKDVSVLAVDDIEMNLKIIGLLMEKYGVTAELADSGKKAVELCENKKFDLIFMDQMMPELDGIQAMKKIREMGEYYQAGGPCKIIVLTANAIEGAKEELLQEGFDGYLSKPIDVKLLEKSLIDSLPEDKFC